VERSLAAPAIGVKMEWRKLLFMHWPVAPDVLRPLIPAGLDVDTYEGHGYVALVPFTMSGIRWSYTPEIPWISTFHEFNVRTYVRRNAAGPGVWFFSLDAARLLAVMAARRAFFLPYYHARMRMVAGEDRVDYRTERFGAPRGRAFFRGSYGGGRELPRSSPGSLEYFLTERYCLYAASPRGTIYRASVHHAPWQLREGRVFDYESDLVEVAGLPAPTGLPLLHYSEFISVWSGIPTRC
jgi:uncharacterized protein YqjF (DUF2071 family)